VADLPPTSTPEPDGMTFGGLEGVGVLPLDVPADEPPLWAVFTRGFSSSNQRHFLAIYTRENDAWQELDRHELDTSDVVFEDGVQQVEVAPGRTWIEVRSGAGAHGGVYDLLSFDGTTLHEEVMGFSANPGAGDLQDLNGDEVPEVVLDQSDYYVFCYACGVVEVNYQVLRWDGTQMAEVALEPLPQTAPDALLQASNEAITLARAGLWQDAALLAEQADQINDTLDEPNPTAAWNSDLILLTAEGRAEHARTSAYPLLGNLFYGDYTAIMGILSGYSPEELFSRPNPLIVGTPAEGGVFEEALIERIRTYTTWALDVRPNLATAYFLRGWANYLADPTSPMAQQDVERAAELNPDQLLFTASAAYLRDMPVMDDTAAILGAVETYMRARSAGQFEPVVVIDKIEGNFARATITAANEGIEPLVVFLRYENGLWSVIAEGNGSEQEQNALDQLGIPESISRDQASTPLTSDEEAAIVNTVRATLGQYGETEDFRVDVWDVAGDYARARADPRDSTTDPATVFLARRGGQWGVITWGTAFDPAELRAQGIPEQLVTLEADIADATMAYARRNPDMAEPLYAEVQRVQDGYARVWVEPVDQQIDGVIAFMQRQDDAWVLLTFGTGFGPDVFEEYEIPPALQEP
jgi:tetratricopeptide (TPR) repeat protein